MAAPTRVEVKDLATVLFRDREVEECFGIANECLGVMSSARLVEDLIQESMAKGEFNNLKGMGKPLKTSSDYNPMIDSTTHNLNKIMIEQGYAPEWVMLDREIK